MNFNRIVPGTIRSALADESPIVRSDGKLIRDYFYVKDAVAAYLALAERLPHEEFDGEAFNFSTETPMSVIELVEAVLRVMGKTGLEPMVLNEANHEIPEQYLACGKAKAMLGWEPGYTLADGLKETVEWYTEYLRDAG